MIITFCDTKMISFVTLLVLVKIVNGIDLSGSPTWYEAKVMNSSNTRKYVCSDIEGLVVCLRDVQQVQLSAGICMTYDDDTEEVSVGICPYAVFDIRYAALQKEGYVYIPQNVSELNQFMCESWGRQGYLCSDCKDGYGLTIANVFIKCVKCKLPSRLAWLFYFMLELIPLTVLFFVVSVFRISLAKPPMNAYVVFCQLALALLFTHTHQFNPPYVMDSPWLKGLHRMYLIVLGAWDMTLTRFFETVTNFCVDPNISMQQAFTITQVHSLFPLVLIGLTSIVIELHARNCRVIVWLWKPFHKYFVCCTRVWNSKLSLIDVFSTYLLLSFSRFIIQLHFIFSFQHPYKLSSKQCYSTRLLYNPSVPYLNVVDHLPYALVLLLIFFIIGLPPVILLAFYQFRVFQRIFRCTGLYRSHRVHTFIDLFHGYYKDGTNGTCDLRFTSSLYLLTRVVVFLCFILCDFTTLTGCQTVSVFLWVLLLLLFIALARPYKDQRMNILDSLLLANLAVVCLLLTGMYPTVENQYINVLILTVIFVVIAIPHAILFVFAVSKVCRCLRYCHVCLLLKNKLRLISSAEVEVLESVAERTDNSYNNFAALD